MANKLTFAADGAACYRHMDELRTILGKDTTLPSVDNLSTLTINYALSLQMDTNLLDKLRAAVELAEDDTVGFTMDVTDDQIQVYAECVRLLEDLKVINQERKHRILWSEN